LTEPIRNPANFTVRPPWPAELERAHLNAAARSVAAEERHLRVLVVGDPERLVGAAVLHLPTEAQPARLTFDLRPRFIGDPIGAAFLVEVVFLAACRNVSAVVIDLPRESPLLALLESHGFVHESPATAAATCRLRRTFPHTPSTA
jgi:hypothetical protein